MQSPVALTVVGLSVIVATVAILMRGRHHPIAVMTLIPVAGALLVGSSFGDLAGYFSEGLSSVMNIVVMFIFAIIFFGIMQDVGLFDPVVRGLIRATRGKVMYAALGTAGIGIVAHLDGAGATTFLLTIPALLPLYKALHMSRYVLLTLIAIAASVMNMLPWAGPVGRAASVIEADPAQLWRHLLPLQMVAIVLVFVVAAILGASEQRRIARLRTRADFRGDAGAVDVDAIAEEFMAARRAAHAEAGYSHRRGRIVTAANIVLTFGLVAALLSGLLPPAPAFLIATSLALLVNFAGDEQQKCLRRHAPNALTMAGVIIAAAMFLGVLNETGMLEQIALSLLAVLPSSVGPYLHIIVAYLGVPLELVTSTDAYYFSLLPIVQQAAATFGVSGIGVATALMIGAIIATFVTPFAPALWLAIGLAEANMGRYLRFAFPIVWVFAIVLVTLGLFTGRFE